MEEELDEFMKVPMDAAQPDAIVNEQCGQSTAKKHSQYFLLKLEEQCTATDLPEVFEITADIAEALISANIISSHHGLSKNKKRNIKKIISSLVIDLLHSTGRITDRSGGMSQIDGCGSGVIEEDKWSKVYSAFHSRMRLDGIGGNTGCGTGQGGNFGVLRNPPMQYAGRILSGPRQSMVNQGGMQGNIPDGERWQRATSLKHRQLKAILNKLTPQNFEVAFELVKAVNIDNAVTLTGFVSQIFEKALMEPTFCEMYANFCLHLAAALPDFSQDNEKITFRRLLLNKCQEEFERGVREEEEANKADEGEVKQSDEEREEKRAKARRRMLGNIRLIGELYKKRMLTERIMHECIKKLLGQYQDPDEDDIEAFCILMSTIGEMIDHPKAKEHMDVYFEMMQSLSNNTNLSSGVRFMLKDVIDLRKNKWKQRRNVEGPKKIEELPVDVAQPDAIANEQCGRSKAELDDWEDAAANMSADSGTSDQQSADLLETTSKHCKDSSENAGSGSVSLPAAADTKDRPMFEPSKVKATSKRKKKEAVVSLENIVSVSTSGNLEQLPMDAAQSVEIAKVVGNTGCGTGQGGSFGFLRNPCAQTPMQYAGGILAGPMQSMVNQGGMQRNIPSGERWQRAASLKHRGLIPSASSQSSLQMLHKGEKKYEVGIVADEEEVKQRQLKAILNNLAPQNFEKVFEQVKAVNIDNVVTLNGVVSQIFEKALMEPTLCEMYANFCLHLAAALPDLSQDNEKITFKRLLINKCQEEFERGEREEEEAKADEGEVKQSHEEREEKRAKARRRMLGNIRLIGELYKKKMLAERNEDNA